MATALLIVHVVLCLVLCGVILLQQGKGASIGAAFGGGSQTIFGGRGPATFFQKMTTGVALCFLLTALGLARVARTTMEVNNSVIETVPAADVAPTPEAFPVPEAAPSEAPTEPTTPAQP
ncbi:MAG: preprotein translocase subunit SecG [Deltaproteobacteria bacterium]|nr:preprotein translocase subunit SecG [Deltaproteobacteria bacterium]